MKVGILQLQSIDDLSANIHQILQLLNKALQLEPEARIFFLPENALFFRLKEGAEIPAYQLEDSFWEPLQTWVDENQRALHVGSVPIELNEKLYNSSVFLKPFEPRVASYQKMHLFDIQLSGDRSIRESDRFAYGEKPSLFEYEGFLFGETICYDLRFSNLFEVYAKKAVDVILIPSAFLVKTGAAHWHVLNRARAIESQCYIISAAQAGTHINSNGASRSTYGHSLAVDPWGQVLAEGDEKGPDVLIVELKKSELESVRKQIPQLSHRRTIPN